MLQKGLLHTSQCQKTNDMYTKLSSMKKLSLQCKHIIAVDTAMKAQWKVQCCQVLPLLLNLPDDFAVLLYFEFVCLIQHDGNTKGDKTPNIHIMEKWQTQGDSQFHDEMIWIIHIYKYVTKSYVHALLILCKHFYNIWQIILIFPLR